MYNTASINPRGQSVTHSKVSSTKKNDVGGKRTGVVSLDLLGGEKMHKNYYAKKKIDPTEEEVVV